MSKHKLYFFLLIVIILVKNSSEALLCEELLATGKSEKELIKEIDTKMQRLKTELGCIEIFLRKGLYNLTEAFLIELTKRNIKFREILKSAINNINKKMEDVHNKFRFDESDYQTVAPAFMWAQSLSNVYLMIKFGHRHDAPGCLEIKGEEITIHSNIFVFKGYCVQGDIPIKFHLPITMYDEVIGEESTWSSSSVGRLQVTMKKKEAPKYWKNLYKDPSDLPNNIKYWFEMHQKFSDELQKYVDEHEEELEREEEQRNREKRKKRRMERKKNQKASNQTTPEGKNANEDL